MDDGGVESSIIRSRTNATVKRIRSLAQRKDRERTGLFFVEGIRLVGEAVQTGADLECLVVAPDLLRSAFGNEIVETHQQRGGTVLEVTPEVFDTLSQKEGGQGIAAVARQRWTPLEAIQPEGDLAWVAVESVQYPGNLGTLLRTSDAVGAGGAILLGNTADPYDPTALRASMGAVFSQSLARTSLEAFLKWKRERGVTVVGTSPAASHDYQEPVYAPPVVLFMGSEGRGLSDEEQAACDVMVKIPMAGRSDSLNLAVATSLVLYEIFNQRRAMGEKLPGR